jgi:hypothetical protein
MDELRGHSLRSQLASGNSPGPSVLRPAKTDTVESLLAEVHELTKALTGLTCGGSEFFSRRGERYVADIPACVEYVRRAQRDYHARTLRFAERARKAEDELAALREPPTPATHTPAPVAVTGSLQAAQGEARSEVNPAPILPKGEG